MSSHVISYEAPNNCVSKISLSSSSSGPCGRYGHRTVAHENKMILYGGYNGERRFEDTYEYDIISRVWKKMSTSGANPGKRDCHSACLYKGCMIVFGGGNGQGWLSDLLCYDIEKCHWKKLKQRGTRPTPRAGHSTVIYQDSLYLFGGWDGKRTLNDLYEYSFPKSQWRKLKGYGKAPRTRDSHQSVIWDDKVLIIGGGDMNLRLEDMHYYSIKTNRWHRIYYMGNGRVGRAGHIVTLYDKEDKLLMFGGGNGTSWIQNMFEFDLKTNRWIQVDIEKQGQSIPASYGASGVLYRNRMIIFGGGDGLNWYDGVYEYVIEKEYKNRVVTNMEKLRKKRNYCDIKILCM